MFFMCSKFLVTLGLDGIQICAPAPMASTLIVLPLFLSQARLIKIRHDKTE